jgi:hypothetical protein
VEGSDVNFQAFLSMTLMEVYDQHCALGIVYPRIDSPYYQLNWMVNCLQLNFVYCGDRKYCSALSSF